MEPADDAAIHAVLVKMIAKWRAETEVEARVRPETKTEERGELAQTVILSPESVRQERSASSPPDRNEMQETVIVSIARAKEEAPRESGPAREAEVEVPETVIISARETDKQTQLGVESKGAGLQDAEKEKAKKCAADEFLAETVILTVERKEK